MSQIYATEIRIVRRHYDQFYTNKLYNLDEMDKIQETHNLSRLNYEET